MNELIRARASKIAEPTPMGSYKKEDAIFLLKDLSTIHLEEDNETREKKIQSGTHYSEMLPVEYVPNQEYVELFHKTLAQTSLKMAKLVAILSEKILERKGNDVILISLARAGSPIGVLVKRYLKFKYNIDVPHYSISIIRGKGLDENAMVYILNKHGHANVQFIDGWTGKGAINNVLSEACDEFEGKYGVKLDKQLSVLADPSYSVNLYATREDFLIPSACLNSTVSGLTTRTVLREDIVGEYEFHGAKFYKEWSDIDLSEYYVDEISKHFVEISLTEEDLNISGEILNLGMKQVEKIQKEFDISSLHFVKPGVGETTRVLLRRVPWKILVDSKENPNLKHILLLAEDRGVPIVEYKEMNYSCIGLIKDVNKENIDV